MTLDVEINGFIPDPSGGTRVGFSATAEINRDEFSVNFNGPIPGTDNAMVLSNKVNLTLEVEASLKASFPGA